MSHKLIVDAIGKESDIYLIDALTNNVSEERIQKVRERKRQNVEMKS